MAEDVHQGQRVLEAGVPVSEAAGAMVLVHGRYSSARNMLTLVPELDRADFAYRAPHAAGGSWYPRPFMAPFADNEPALSSALVRLSEVVEELERKGMPSERIMLLGFSQGACLALELAARSPRRWGGVVGLTGAVMGPDGTERDDSGSFAGTPVLLATSDPDPFVPVRRVRETAELFRRMDAEVELEIYPGMGHTISHPEITLVRRMMDQLAAV